MWLSRRIKARRKAILLNIPDALDLLTISVRAGLGFDAALAKVVEKMNGPAHRRVPAGARRDAGRQGPQGCAARHRRADPGAGADQLHRRHHPGRDPRRVHQQGAPDPVGAAAHRASSAGRGEAAKAPIKMLFPLVGCIFPSIFIVILGPAIISIMVNLGGKV